MPPRLSPLLHVVLLRHKFYILLFVSWLQLVSCLLALTRKHEAQIWETVGHKLTQLDLQKSDHQGNTLTSTHSFIHSFRYSELVFCSCANWKSLGLFVYFKNMYFFKGFCCCHLTGKSGCEGRLIEEAMLKVCNQASCIVAKFMKFHTSPHPLFCY